MKKERLFINLISNIISFGLQLGISFILTPIIVNKVGDAAYGFIGLANNFVSYATIFTVIINSMASRFITMELAKGKEESANRYFSSVLVMDIIMSILVAIVSMILIFNLHIFLDIPNELEFDVKITFALAFINLILSIMNTVFSVAAFAKNRLDLQAIENIKGNILKAIFLIVVFTILTPKIYYITLGSIIFTAYIMFAYIKITKKLAPELKYSLKKYDRGCVKILIKSGIWNSINSLGRTLLTGMDLLIANIFVGADAMGVLSIAKTIPTSIENLLVTIANIFSPQFVILYSKRKIKELVQAVNFSMKITAILMLVPLAGFIAFGTPFFTLWLSSKNNQEIQLIQILSIISLMPFVISASNYTLFLLDSATNKLKRPVFATLIMSIISTITTLILLYTTDLGIYAVAGVSSIYWIIKVIIFNNINAAKNLRIKWNTFFNQFLKNLGCFTIILILFIIINKILIIKTWTKFLVTAFACGFLGYVLAFFILLNKEEKIKVFTLIRRKIIVK